jgi:hypothetical protein
MNKVQSQISKVNNYLFIYFCRLGIDTDEVKLESDAVKIKIINATENGNFSVIN